MFIAKTLKVTLYIVQRYTLSSLRVINSLPLVATLVYKRRALLIAKASLSTKEAFTSFSIFSTSVYTISLI